MKKFFKLLVFILVPLFSISNVFAYELNSSEKIRLDIIVQKLEISISGKGESYRSIYVSKLNELKNRTSDDKIRTYIDYVVESLNKSIDFFNILGNIDNQYPGCSATSKYINGHTYSLSPMYNGESSTVTITLSVSGGYDTYKQTFTCSNGIVNNIGYEQYVSTTCNSSYYLSGRSCISSYNVNRSCDSINQVVNGHTYYLSSLSSGYTYSRTTSYNIANGYDTYKQSFSCYNGTFSTSGNEEYVSTTCNSGYYLSGRSCYSNYYYNNNNNNYNYNYYNNYNDCAGTTKYYNGYSAYVDFLYNGNKRQVSFNIGNGYRYITYLCSNGNLIEDSYYTSCSSGYYWNGSYCYYNYTPTYNNCSAVSSFLVGTDERHSYPVPAFNNGSNITQTITVNVYGGVKVFSQSFYCSNGTTTITSNSPEKLVSFTCNAGYRKSANGTMCEKDNIINQCLRGTIGLGTSSVNGIKRGYYLDNTLNSGSEIVIRFNQAEYIIDEPASTQKFMCNSNGVLSPVGNEVFTCKSGYRLESSNNTCVRY